MRRIVAKTEAAAFLRLDAENCTEFPRVGEARTSSPARL